MPNDTLADGRTVKNKIGARSHEDLEADETDLVKAREEEHRAAPSIKRTFDEAHP